MRILHGVSIVVCTYNGSKRLPKTLYHLVKQVVPPDLAWEVIVVDNNSSDNSSAIARGEWAQYNLPVPFDVVLQPLQGLSHAREKGYLVSKYNYILFCDDDNWLAEDYVEKLNEIFDCNQQVGIVGGRSTGSFETTPPPWFNNFSTAYAVGQRRETSTYIDWVAGAGIGVRREALDLLKKSNFQPILTGRKGKALTSGEDLELCGAVRAIGYEIYYAVDLNFVHYMPANRLNWQYLRKMVRGISWASSVFDMYSIIGKLLKDGNALNFKTVHNMLWDNIFNQLKIRCGTVRKSFRFLKSIVILKEGDSYGHQNRYYLEYLWFLLSRKKELRERYATIEAFFKRAKAINLNT